MQGVVWYQCLVLNAGRAFARLRHNLARARTQKVESAKQHLEEAREALETARKQAKEELGSCPDFDDDEDAHEDWTKQYKAKTRVAKNNYDGKGKGPLSKSCKSYYESMKSDLQQTIDQLDAKYKKAKEIGDFLYYKYKPLEELRNKYDITSSSE